MSDQFVMSQYHYYKKHLFFRGNGASLIHGSFLTFEQEARKRGLL